MALTLPQERIARAALALALWLLPAAGVWLYLTARHAGQLDAARAEGRADCAEAQLEALGDAAADQARQHQEAQARITAQAQADAATIAATIAQAQRRADRLTQELARHADLHPLPAGCRADPERVRLYNEARRGGAAAPAAAGPGL
jgi:hypothetical protein